MRLADGRIAEREGADQPGCDGAAGKAKGQACQQGELTHPHASLPDLPPGMFVFIDAAFFYCVGDFDNRWD